MATTTPGIAFLKDRDKPRDPDLPIILDFEEGDLIYGLSSGRALYVAAQLFLRPGVSTIVMVDDMNNQFLGTNVKGMVSANQKALGVEGTQAEYNPDKAKLQALDFKRYLETNTKKGPQTTPGPDGVATRIKRACKGGLEFTTVVQKKRIHFFLDGLIMTSIVQKTDFGTGKPETKEEKSVTGCELRWLYRNRKRKDVMDRVVFWKANAKVPPPWEDPSSKDLWSSYKPRSEKQSPIITSVLDKINFWS